MPFGDGSVLGSRYRLLSQVGRGGMGRVWHAHDDLLHRDVAVKEVLFPPGLTPSDREVLYERTLREARSAARLSHPAIVTVHDVVEEDGRPWIVMEFVRAPSLQEVIDRDGPLPPVQVAEIGTQMLAALRAAHASGVLHRDVKPANVLLDAGPGATRVVITDFGIARVDGDATLTQTGLVLGSPAYIAPERARGETAGPASDLWALGATLYAACEGRAPHDRAEAMAALTSVLHEDAPPPRRAGPLGPVLLALLEKDPNHRATAAQAAEGLARVARGDAPDVAEATLRDIPGSLTLPAPQPVPLPGSPTLPAPPAARKRAPRVLLIAAIVLVAVAAASAATFVMNRSDRRKPTPPPTSSPPTTAPAPTPTLTVPVGFHRSAGPGGASMVVPAGWTRQVISGASVRWTQPGTGAHIQLDSIPWRVDDPVEHWRRFQSEVTAKRTLPGYRLIHLGDRFVVRDGWPAADLEYTWETRSSGTLRAYDRGFTANGHQYAILVAAPAGEWPRYASLLNTIFAAFQPAPR